MALILSSNQPGPEPERRRRAVRESWADEELRLGGPDGDAPPCSLRFLFVLGGAATPQLRGSELSLPVQDGYRELSYKVVGAMRWLLASVTFELEPNPNPDPYWPSPSPHPDDNPNPHPNPDQVAFKFALKTDDDSFVCVARLLEQLHALPRTRVYLGAISKKRKVITDPSHEHFARWGDRDYVALFNRSVYTAYMQVHGTDMHACAPTACASLREHVQRQLVRYAGSPCTLRCVGEPCTIRSRVRVAAYGVYMQGAGYVLSSDLVATVARRAAGLPRLPAIEDALIGTLLEGHATPTNRPAVIRYKNRDEYAVTVCEKDTEFALVHKLSVDELRRCKQATQRRRSPRCPKGPCVCRTLGQTLHRPKLFVDSFTRAEEMRAETETTDSESQSTL